MAERTSALPVDEPRQCITCGGWFETGKLHLCVPLVPAKSQVRVVICQGQNLSPESLKALMDMALKAFDSEGE